AHKNRSFVLPVLLHGDAAFAGQGVVAETLNLSQLRGYRTGGTIHLVINNQIGFTTGPEAARSSWYATDVAKMVQAPIFHVNGDDPEACVRAMKLAYDFRQQFHKDVVLDILCYRRHGHNEGDEPSLTQPKMYKLIKEHRSVRKIYTEQLLRKGDISPEEAERWLDQFQAKLQEAFDRTKEQEAPPSQRDPIWTDAEVSLAVYDSLLSEYGVLGFEYGYSVSDPGALVVWEAQFGDFMNGAQIIIDQFLSSAEEKWGQHSGLVMLLPHGYEGQGPEHSSARLARFLTLCAEGNMQVIYPTTPAQYFHALRRQMKNNPRKPLIVTTPKSLLRHPMAVSAVNELTNGRFEPVLHDVATSEEVKRVILTSGKVYYDLKQARD